MRHIKLSKQRYFKYFKEHPSESLCVCTSPPTQHVIFRVSIEIIRFMLEYITSYNV